MKMVHNKTHFDNFDVVIDIRCRKKWCVMVRHDESQHIDGIGFIYGCIISLCFLFKVSSLEAARWKIGKSGMEINRGLTVINRSWSMELMEFHVAMRKLFGIFMWTFHHLRVFQFSMIGSWTGNFSPWPRCGGESLQRPNASVFSLGNSSIGLGLNMDQVAWVKVLGTDQQIFVMVSTIFDPSFFWGYGWPIIFCLGHWVMFG